MNTLEIAAIGLQQDADRLRVISHNVANATTPGYKRQMMVQAPFSTLVDAEIAGRAAMAQHTDLGAGKLQSTGNALDVALAAREYLLVKTADGVDALTRGGSLQIDARGRLSTQGGLVVQGTSGDLVVPAIASSVRIDSSGQLLADDKAVGAMSVVRLSDKAQLRPLGEGLFAMPDAVDAPQVSAPRVQPGHTEASNVVSSQEMVQLVATVRHAESMARLIQGADEQLERTIRKLGEM
jgi:flagellar basal-body rod protein FlgF